MTTTPEPRGFFEELHREEFARLFAKIIGARIYVAPVVGTLAIGLGIWEPMPWRRIVLIGLAFAMISLSVVEVWRYRRFGMTPRSADLNIAAGVLGQLVITSITGGLESPTLPPMVLLSLFVGMIMIERPWYFWGLLGLQISSLWVMGYVAVHGLVPGYNLELFGGGVRAGHGAIHLWTTAAVMTLAIIGAAALGRGQRNVFGTMVWRALESTEQLRREHAERSREMVALFGEIAHELKNPMSTVKGLSALLTQNVGEEGKGAERLKVLRHEVDRMQSVLEEFLNFSRPVVPLSVERADLARLSTEIVELHEGLAREKGLALGVKAAQAQVRCDPRKVRQILVNLVQNALEASAPGAAVEVVCAARSDGGAQVEVLDRGSGLSPEILSRLFEPGATTKPKGTGLGLTIARALARQHGGELTLAARPGGGCVAQLVLPAEPVIAARQGQGQGESEGAGA
ncbi:MAG TPA: HAMP domain-containing sensor histidine kinase [Myxococcales bacterium]|jgi:signal transduction histidine kinase